jgi:hypothetical protein
MMIESHSQLVDGDTMGVGGGSLNLRLGSPKVPRFIEMCSDAAADTTDNTADI